MITQRRPTFPRSILMETRTSQHKHHIQNHIRDLVIDETSLTPTKTTLDITVSCPLLPTYCTAAALSSQTLFTRRALEKNKKHLNGCIDLGRHFLPLVFSSLGGLGPPESVEYLDRLYANAYTTELRLGGHGAETHHQRTTFYQTLQAILANQSTTKTWVLIMQISQNRIIQKKKRAHSDPCRKQLGTC